MYDYMGVGESKHKTLLLILKLHSWFVLCCLVSRKSREFDFI